MNPNILPEEILPEEQEIEQKIHKFKSVLGDKNLTDEIVVQKYIIDGATHVFRNNEEAYFDLKSSIGIFFDEKPANIHMVGSGKLGFSISPNKKQNKLWRHFSEESDIDIVVVSEKSFVKFWEELYDFNISLTNRTVKEEEKYQRFLKYFFKGWLRPDLFPFRYSNKDKWLDFFKSISYKYSSHKISGAVYYNYSFFEKYHIQNVKNLRLERILNE